MSNTAALSRITMGLLHRKKLYSNLENLQENYINSLLHSLYASIVHSRVDARFGSFLPFLGQNIIRDSEMILKTSEL
jgi:hypothetical protein